MYLCYYAADRYCKIDLKLKLALKLRSIAMCSSHVYTEIYKERVSPRVWDYICTP